MMHVATIDLKISGDSLVTVKCDEEKYDCFQVWGIAVLRVWELQTRMKAEMMDRHRVGLAWLCWGENCVGKLEAYSEKSVTEAL